MTIVAGGGIEQGAYWEILREVIPPEYAMMAGKQALTLIDDESEYVSQSDYSPPGQAGMQIYRFQAWHPRTFPDYPHTIQGDERASGTCTELLDVHRRIQKMVSSHVDLGFFNVYEPGGHTRRHRDKYRDETVALGLLGVAECVITDPVSRQSHIFDIHPGDAIHLINPRKQSLRPRHQVSNKSNRVRISLVA